MRIVPAVDLIGGKVVRLRQGDFGQVSEYPMSAMEAVQQFGTLGFKFIHVVDLEGAKEGKPMNQAVVEQMIRAGFSIQVGGGIRTIDDARSYFAMGAERIILGTRAVEDPGFWREAAGEFTPERLVLSLDIKEGRVAVKGWKEVSSLTFDELLERIGPDLVKHVLVTGVDRDGTMHGPDLDLYNSIKTKYPKLNVISAGGVGKALDLILLQKLGVQEAISGKAFYENQELLERAGFANQMIDEVNWEKVAGMLPVIIQDTTVRMLGYMNKEALFTTILSQQVVFFSRTKNRLWKKGETSGNTLDVLSMKLDCDKDALLIEVKAIGNTCHEGTESCFDVEKPFLNKLEEIIDQGLDGTRLGYVSKLADEGLYRIAQKIGEEGVEVALASVKGDQKEILEESADLLFHLLVNLRYNHLALKDVELVLKERHGKKSSNNDHRHPEQGAS